jgi:uncharacterized protein DUF4382
MRKLTWFPGVLAVLALAACNGDTGPRMGRITVRLTDAPLAGVGTATVWVSKVYLVGGEGGPFTISDTPVEYDLLALQDGVTALLGSALIPVGDYEQLRLVVDSAVITLADGMTFSDGTTSRSLKTPSAGRSGLKVNFGGPVHVAPGETDLVVDFDVSRNFVFLGDRTHPDGVIFTPVLHASATDISGSIAGTSLPVEARGHLFAIQGTDTVTSALADTLDGTYKLWFLPPGTYTVADSAVGYTTATQTVTVGNSQAVTGVDFTLLKK